MVKISLVVCVLAIFAFVQTVSSKTTAPAPAVDCSTIIFSMADCLTFVTNGSKVTKPEGACCNGLKTVLKTDAQCICKTFKNSGSLVALALSPGGAPGSSICGSTNNSKDLISRSSLSSSQNQEVFKPK